MKKLIILAIAILGLASCSKSESELKELRIDAMNGALAVQVVKNTGEIETLELRGNMEGRYLVSEVQYVKGVSLEYGTKGRVNGWIIEPMNEGDSFVYYPETDELTKWKEVK